MSESTLNLNDGPTGWRPVGLPAGRIIDAASGPEYNGKRLGGKRHGVGRAIMLEENYIDKHLAKTICYNCGRSLEGAQVVPISEIPMAVIAHAVCPNCESACMITITIAGTGTLPIISDLTGAEVRKFISAKSITVDELLDLHLMLKGKSVCKLLHNKDHNLARKTKHLEKAAAFRR